MSRQEIKEEAKAKIKGNIWNILWPLLVIGVLSGIISTIFGGNQAYSGDSVRVTLNFGSTASTLISAFLSAGYIKYLLTFVRTGKFNTDEIINTIKEKWLHILVANILVGIIVFACSLLLVIPGIIMALAYTFVLYLIVDKDYAVGPDALKASREMMRGYKWDYFVFELSFIGWIILGVFTLGILYIWLIPYMQVASVLYYEKLLAKQK